MLNFQQKGENIDFVETAITHPSHPTILDPVTNTQLSMVQGGDPCLVGQLHGVAATTAFTSADIVDIQVEGVFRVNVTGPVAVGDRIYANASTVALTTTNTGVPFGIALEVVNTGVTAQIAVKLVH